MGSFYANFPAGREFKPRQAAPSDSPAPDSNGLPASTDTGGASDVPSSTSTTDPNAAPTPTDHFVPSFNNPPPWVASSSVPGDPSSTDVSSLGLPVSSSVILSSTSTPESTPTGVTLGSSAVSSGSSNRKYIIGGAVGGGVLVIIILALLLCCCKRRGKKDLERAAGGNHEGQQHGHGHGQFACCDHGTGNKKEGAAHMGQKTPLKPFALKSDLAPPVPQEITEQYKVALDRRASAESQISAGSDDYSESAYSTDSDGTRRKSHKRPPPLKLTSLVTPVVNGPQNNPRRVNRSSVPTLSSIVVDPPHSGVPDRMKRY